MITLKPTCQDTLPVLDQHPPRRPALIEGAVDTDDLAHRPLTRIGVGPIREPHPQPVAEMLFQAVLYVSDAATVALNSTRPSMDSQRPPKVWTLLTTAT
jgi:hypothetical protein